ncbi:MAG: hypothetical protein K2N07_10250, partial [Desulfovibrio sp.]|nr:hypothetical protein [Desulfovibrio sp.]
MPGPFLTAMRRICQTVLKSRRARRFRALAAVCALGLWLLATPVTARAEAPAGGLPAQAPEAAVEALRADRGLAPLSPH